MIRQLPLDEVIAGVFGQRCPTVDEAPENELLPVSGAIMKLGKPWDYPLYGWDNEYGEQQEEVADFEAAKYLTSNREFLAFVEDSGYETESYWTEGWECVYFQNHGDALFWRKGRMATGYV